MHLNPSAITNTLSEREIEDVKFYFDWQVPPLKVKSDVDTVYEVCRDIQAKCPARRRLI